MDPSRRPLAVQLPAALWAIGSSVLLLAPLGPEPAGWLPLAAFAEAGGDKLVHAALFAVQAILVLRVFEAGHRRGGPLWALLLCLAWGLVTEILQSGVPGRSSALADFVADGLGALAGIAFWSLERRPRPARLPDC